MPRTIFQAGDGFLVQDDDGEILNEFETYDDAVSYIAWLEGGEQ